MPAKTKRMQRFMGMCAHSPGKAKGKCPPMKVAREFSHKPTGGYRKKKKVVLRVGKYY
jgi:hypothetical protein